MKLAWLLTCLLFLATGTAAAQTIEVHRISSKGVGAAVGTITLAGIDAGVLFAPKLNGFKPGPHAFHVHEKPDCGSGISGGKPVAGLAAGAHYAGRGGMAMAGMSGMNMMHMAGDLPELVAARDGAITQSVTKAGLTLAELHGRSVMIHQYGEKPGDPALPAGGGARIACAVIP